jgi:hypothetical protein
MGESFDRVLPLVEGQFGQEDAELSASERSLIESGFDVTEVVTGTTAK